MSQPDFDVYQGMSWTERARFGVFGVALDLADRTGKKNRFLDAVHKTALRRFFDASRRRFERALDFGCGGGRLLPLLTQYANQVYGVDRTQACLDLARAQHVIPEERLACWRDGPLPFSDGFFDLLLCVYVLLTGDALETLTPEMGRVCASGGLALVLEQTDNGRGLTLERYRTTFEKAGFTLRNVRAVRRSSRSRAQWLATRSWAPRWLGDLAVRWELAAMQRARYDAGTPGYFDYLLVFEKIAA
ncbi:MAG TPA: class I SAM-dependent methyltransferase [Candidatus Eremiobacteraceae bacterium]|nr:class I SAM-dependent methyltransferase [Candidatus Eremiobacteraceae bacterium]